ncbi:hypothetical protein Hdeb2414_s0006g00222931 [Helianthus debilis subsp. tardiflorus]
MLRSLSDVRMGDFKLKFNVARFFLEDREINQTRKDSYHYRPKVRNGTGPTFKIPNMKGSCVNNVSFKEASTGVFIGKTVVVDDGLVAFSDLHRRAIFVRLKSLYVLQNIIGILKEMKLGEGRVRCLGGLSVLIEFKSKEHASMAKDEMIGRKEEFDCPLIWEGQTIPFERVAWLKISGLPLCMDVKVLNDIGSLFGVVVKEARVDRLACDSSFHFIGVIVNHARIIHEAACVRWRGSSYKVWVSEIDKEWIGDFVLGSKSENGWNVDEEMNEQSSEASEEPEPTPVKVSSPVTNITPNKEILNGEIMGDSVSFDRVEKSTNQFQKEGDFGSREFFTGGNLANNQSIAKSLKRKKFKSFVNLDLDSSGGSSSGNNRPNKESKKGDEDIFGLEPLIWAGNEFDRHLTNKGLVIVANNFTVLESLLVEEEGEEIQTK